MCLRVVIECLEVLIGGLEMFMGVCDVPAKLRRKGG